VHKYSSGYSSYEYRARIFPIGHFYSIFKYNEYPSYQKYHNNVKKHTEDLAFNAMINAGKEESALAIMENNVNEKGIPLITMLADGAWSKRSYKSGYNALSGVVSILSYFVK